MPFIGKRPFSSKISIYVRYLSQVFKHAFQEVTGSTFPFCRFSVSVCCFVTFVYQKYLHFKIIESLTNFVFDIIPALWNYAKIQEYCHTIMLSKESSSTPLKPLVMYFSFKVIY